MVHRRFFLRATRMVSTDERLEAMPTITAGKKNAYRSISTDWRIIDDMGRANLRFPPSQYYPVVVPSVTDLGRWIMGLHGMYPGVELVATKLDVAAAFRLLRLRPALSLLMATEFPANHIPLPHDLVCIYLVTPFGWNGSPANFARSGDEIASAHLQSGLSRSARHLDHAFRSVMYVDDGSFIELHIPIRLTKTTSFWELPTRGILGDHSLNEDKLSIDGTWESEQIFLGSPVTSRILRLASQNRRWAVRRFSPTHCSINEDPIS